MKHHVGNRPATEPPEPGTYSFVVRRADRALRPWRLALGYSEPPSVARSITTPWDGETQPTLFLQTEGQRKSAWIKGWRDDITRRWMAHLEQSVEADEATEDRDQLSDTDRLWLEGLGFRDLQVQLKKRGHSASGSTDELRARLRQAIESGNDEAGDPGGVEEGSPPTAISLAATG